MDLRFLKAAGSRAYQGFQARDGGLGGKSDQRMAGTFFKNYTSKEKKQLDNIIIHDREHPQPPPHAYIAGSPGPLHYGIPLSDEHDPGVSAVSHALFGGSPSFTSIPIEARPVFRRRRRGDGFSEWSNAFVTRVDPCECVSPEETYTPYEVAKYKDSLGRTHTTINFTA